MLGTKVSVSMYSHILVDAGDRRHSVEPNARTTIWFVGNQNEIVRPGAHVEQCLELALGEETTARNVSDGVFGDTLGIENDM